MLGLELSVQEYYTGAFVTVFLSSVFEMNLTLHLHYMCLSFEFRSVESDRESLMIEQGEFSTAIIDVINL